MVVVVWIVVRVVDGGRASVLRFLCLELLLLLLLLRVVRGK